MSCGSSTGFMALGGPGDVRFSDGRALTREHFVDQVTGGGNRPDHILRL